MENKQTAEIVTPQDVKRIIEIGILIQSVLTPNEISRLKLTAGRHSAHQSNIRIDINP